MLTSRRCSPVELDDSKSKAVPTLNSNSLSSMCAVVSKMAREPPAPTSYPTLHPVNLLSTKVNSFVHASSSRRPTSTAPKCSWYEHFICDAGGGRLETSTRCRLKTKQGFGQSQDPSATRVSQVASRHMPVPGYIPTAILGMRWPVASATSSSSEAKKAWRVLAGRIKIRHHHTKAKETTYTKSCDSRSQ